MSATQPRDILAAFCRITTSDLLAFEPRASIPDRKRGSPIVFFGHAVPLDEGLPVWDKIREIIETTVVNDAYGCENTEAILCIGDNSKRDYGVSEAQKEALKNLLGEPLWYLSLLKPKWTGT